MKNTAKNLYSNIRQFLQKNNTYIKSAVIAYAVALLLGLCLPLLFGLLLELSTCIFKNRSLITVTNAYNIDFNQYISIIISAITSIFSVGIGINTYRLSQKKSDSNEELAKTKMKVAIPFVVSEIRINAKIIEDCENNISDRYEDISVIKVSDIEYFGNALRPEELTMIVDLFNMFNYYRRIGQMTPNDKNKWMFQDGNLLFKLNIGSIIDMLNNIKEE